jgi:hypothetical protein
MHMGKIESAKAKLEISDPSTRFASELNNKSFMSTATPLHQKGRR